MAFSKWCHWFPYDISKCRYILFSTFCYSGHKVRGNFVSSKELPIEVSTSVVDDLKKPVGWYFSQCV